MLDVNFCHLGFTFLMVRMTEVLAPDILEFTGVYTYNTLLVSVKMYLPITKPCIQYIF
jgi:hypothetical protein